MAFRQSEESLDIFKKQKDGNLSFIIEFECQTEYSCDILDTV